MHWLSATFCSSTLDSGNKSSLHCSLTQTLPAPLLRPSVPLKLLSLNPVQDFATRVIQSVLTFSFHLNCVLRPSWAGIETNAKQRMGQIVLCGCPLCWVLKSITLPSYCVACSLRTMYKLLTSATCSSKQRPYPQIRGWWPNQPKAFIGNIHSPLLQVQSLLDVSQLSGPFSEHVGPAVERFGDATDSPI